MMGMDLCLFIGGAVFAILGACMRKGSFLVTALASLCVTGGVLSALALGKTLESLLSPLLILCVVAMASRTMTRGGDDS